MTDKTSDSDESLRLRLVIARHRFLNSSSYKSTVNDLDSIGIDFLVKGKREELIPPEWIWVALRVPEIGLALSLGLELAPVYDGFGCYCYMTPDAIECLINFMESVS